MRFLIGTKAGKKVVDLNRRLAIRHLCLDCSGWSIKEVLNCSHENCPLHPFRLGQSPQNTKKRAAAIRKYCSWCMNGRRVEVSGCPTKTCPLFPYRQSRLDRSVEIIDQVYRKAV